MIDNQQASISSYQTHLGAEETTVLIVDKIIKVSEVTSEKVEIYYGTHQDKLAEQNFVAELDQSIHPDKGKSGNLNCANVQKSAGAFGPEAQEKIQEVHLGNVGQVTDYSQVVGAFYFVCHNWLFCFSLPLDELSMHSVQNASVASITRKE